MTHSKAYPFGVLLLLVLASGCAARKCAWSGASPRVITMDTTWLQYEAFRGKQPGDIVQIPCGSGKGTLLARLTDVGKYHKLMVHYVYWDANKMDLAHIDSLRSVVYLELQRGTTFERLAEQYTMDGNMTGELRWVNSDNLVPEFTNIVLAHRMSDVFRVDIPDRNWYYVVRKDENHRTIMTYTVERIPPPGIF